jgi:hypothetical protein
MVCSAQLVVLQQMVLVVVLVAVLVVVAVASRLHLAVAVQTSCRRLILVCLKVPTLSNRLKVVCDNQVCSAAQGSSKVCIPCRCCAVADLCVLLLLLLLPPRR